MDRPTRLPFTATFGVALLVTTIAACGGSNPSATGAASPGPTTPVGTPAGTPRPTPIPVATGTPLGDRLLATLTVDQSPCAMAADATAVWITSGAKGLVDRVDPATNTITARVETGGAPCGIAIGPDGRVWVAVLGTGEVVAIDPATNTVTDRIMGVGPALWDLKAGFGSIWVADRMARQVLRIDPATAKIVNRIDVGPLASGLAVLTDSVWVTDDTDGKIRRIDPATDEVTTTIDIGGAPSWFADDGAGTLVVAARGGGKVYVIDPVAGTAGDPIPGWNEALDGTVVGGTAYVPEGSPRKLGVFPVDGSSPVVFYTLPGGVNPFVAEPAFGDVWVLDYGSTKVWRIRP
jgi:hypothetical protein